MNEVSQIMIQDLVLGDKRAIIFKGTDPITVDPAQVLYDDLTQAEKDQWDDFFELIKSKL
jgi:hypothetical protein